jgi:transposase
MFLKKHRVNKDGKEHLYYSLCESVRINRRRVVQRKVLHLGELNGSQVDSWQRTIEAIEEDGSRRQLKLFASEVDSKQRDGDTEEVILSSLSVRNSRRFGDCWIGTKLWEALDLGAFWEKSLAGEGGDVAWAKVIELLTVNRLLDPRSELYVHEKWYRQTAMGFLLGEGDAVAGKDRLYRALDRIVPHKDDLEKHLRDKWVHLFNVSYEVLLYDLTSTYFEGTAKAIPKAKRGYSRDHRSDCKQVVIALIVTTDGFPLTYEILDGNRRDVTTLDEMLQSVENKFGKANRIWVLDRGIVSEENLRILQSRGCRYLVGTPRTQLRLREQQLLDKGDWHSISEELAVKLLPEESDTYVIAKSTLRAGKEGAMRARVITSLMRDLIKLRRALRNKTLVDPTILTHRLGRLHERHSQAWRFITICVDGLTLTWEWDRDRLRRAGAQDGAYLLRTNIKSDDPAELWKQYVQLTEVEAAFRTLKSNLAVRPIWHSTPQRVEAHIMIAFLGYCLWVCLKHTLRMSAPSLTPWQLLEMFRQVQLVEVWFQLRRGGSLCLERITQLDSFQQAALRQIGWDIPAQPPPRIYSH